MCRYPPIRTVRLALLLVAMAPLGCLRRAGAPEAPVPDSGGTLITREQILAMGVQTAMEALERANTPLVIQRTRAGSPVRIYRRGVSSLLLDPQVAVSVDGSLVQDPIRALENVPAGSVQFIQILNAREGALKYGAAGGNGVIEVRTGAVR
jgi:hypothetical protein